MNSPSADVLAKRRYHKHRYKTKKRDTHPSRYNKDSSTKVNALPRVTHKRLTNKSGFCFKGAVLSSPSTRGAKGQEVHKPKKASFDYDLKCILEAAKSRGVPPISTHPHSGSTDTSSGESDDPTDVIENFSKDSRKRKTSAAKAYQFPPSKKEKAVCSRSSSENNIILINDDNLDFENISRISRSTENHLSEAMYQGSQCDGSTPLRDGNPDLNISSENVVPHMSLRPSSLSSYQKFAVGIVDALLIEKKRQCPSSNWLTDIERDLSNIYNKTHGKISCQKQSSSCVKEVELKNNVNCELTGPSAIEVSTRNVATTDLNALIAKGQELQEERDPKNVQNDKTLKKKSVEAWVRNIPQGVVIIHEDRMNFQKESDFKEKAVEAWVKALPENVASLPDQRFKRNNNTNMKNGSTCSETEKQFLKNIKKDLVCKTLLSNPFNSINNVPHKTLQKVSVLDYSPCMPPLKENIPTSIDLVCGTRKSSPVGFDKSSSEVDKHFDFWGYNSPVGSLPVSARRPQQSSWMSWIRGSDENYMLGVDNSKSPDCSSPYFTFDPPASKLHNKMDNGNKVHCNTDSTRQRNKFDSGLSLWSHFPKQMKSENILPDLRRGNADKMNKGKLLHPDYIKFSPRKMF